MPEDSSPRSALARLATNVAIVTASYGAVPHGVTANGWGESADPPLVLVTLTIGSRTLPIVQRSGRFAVNVLAADQEGLARAFARREERPGARFDDVDFRTVGGCPILAGCLAAVVCRLESGAPFGGQEIVVGRIEHAESRDGEPLIFFDRGFRRLAPRRTGVTPVDPASYAPDGP
ncbi:MAG: flavin reductase family protein [Pseudonocardia sp.]|nr:flavin reductase family protein [Pseudonocardia sp.]